MSHPRTKMVQTGTVPRQWTRAQKNALASCCWHACPGCGEIVPVLRGNGFPASGFDDCHKTMCRKQVPGPGPAPSEAPPGGISPAALPLPSFLVPTDSPRVDMGEG